MVRQDYQKERDLDSISPKRKKGESDARNAQKSMDGQTAMKRLSKPIKGTLALAQVLTGISAVLGVAPYMALVELGRLLIEAFRVGSTDEEAIRRTILFLTGTFCARLGIYFVALLVTHFADLKLRSQLRREIVAGMATAPLSWFTASNSGSIRKVVQDDTKLVHTVIAHGPIERINAIMSPIALLAYAFYVDWRLGILSVVTVPIYMFIYSIGMRGMPEKTAEMDTYLERVSATMVEFVSGITVVKAFGRVGKAHGSYSRAADQFSAFYNGWCMPLVNVTCFSKTWISIPVLLLINLGVGSILMHSGYVDFSQLLATTLIALVLPEAIITIATISWSYQLAGSAALRLCEILDLEQLPMPMHGRIPTGLKVEFQNVSFSYGKTLALSEVNLTLEPGTVTALIGPSGSGKTTLATLLARFNDPDSGEITLGGVPLREMDEETLYKEVAFVLQDAQLLNISILENIRLGSPNSKLEEVRSAARIANIDDFIMSLPEQYDTVLGTDTRFSGGQEQRIAIARAVLIDASILILDEATAFADPESEAEIQEALSKLVKNRTVLVIAHRPAAILGADQIVVMDQGRICAVGRHSEIMAEPHYQLLLQQSTAHGELGGAIHAN